MRQQKKIRIINLKIIACPVCMAKKKSSKIKTFKTVQNLNRHLALKHKSKYRIDIVLGITIRKSRLKKSKKGIV